MTQSQLGGYLQKLSRKGVRKPKQEPAEREAASHQSKNVTFIYSWNEKWEYNLITIFY